MCGCGFEFSMLKRCRALYFKILLIAAKHHSKFNNFPKSFPFFTKFTLHPNQQRSVEPSRGKIVLRNGFPKVVRVGERPHGKSVPGSHRGVKLFRKSESYPDTFQLGLFIHDKDESVGTTAWQKTNFQNRAKNVYRILSIFDQPIGGLGGR